MHISPRVGLGEGNDGSVQGMKRDFKAYQLLTPPQPSSSAPDHWLHPSPVTSVLRLHPSLLLCSARAQEERCLTPSATPPLVLQCIASLFVILQHCRSNELSLC